MTRATAVLIGSVFSFGIFHASTNARAFDGTVHGRDAPIDKQQRRAPGSRRLLAADAEAGSKPVVVFTSMGMGNGMACFPIAIKAAVAIGSFVAAVALHKKMDMGEDWGTMGLGSKAFGMLGIKAGYDTMMQLNMCLTNAIFVPPLKPFKQ